MSPLPPIQCTRRTSEAPYPYHDRTFPQKTKNDRFGDRTLPPPEPWSGRPSGPNQKPPGPPSYQWLPVEPQRSEDPPSQPSRIRHGPPMSQQDPRFQPCQVVIIPRESNGQPSSQAQPSPSDSPPSPCESERDFSQKSPTSTQAKEKHKENEQKRRDGEKELYDIIPEIAKKYGVQLGVSKTKNFVTKESKLKGLIECVEILDARVKQREAMAKQREDEVQERRDGGKELYDQVPEITSKFGSKMKVSENRKSVIKCCNHEALMECIETFDARVKELEDEVQKLSREVKDSEVKAKRSEKKARRIRRKLNNLRSQVRNLSSDGAGDTDDDGTTLVGRSISPDSDFVGSTRQSHSGCQLARL